MISIKDQYIWKDVKKQLLSKFAWKFSIYDIYTDVLYTTKL